MTVIGFHPITERERVELVRTDGGDYQVRLVVDGRQVGTTRGAYGRGLVGWQNAQRAGFRWAKGIKRDRGLVR